MFRWMTVLATGLALSAFLTLPAFADRFGAGLGDRFGGFAMVGLAVTAAGVEPYLGFGRAGQAAPGADIVRRLETFRAGPAARDLERRLDDLVCRALPPFDCRHR
jgi:hypothetical protein